MAERYAQLKLYSGSCPADGCGEYRFSPEKRDEYSSARFYRGMNTVQRYLEPTNSWGLVIFGLGSIVRSEDEARMLIEFAEKNIPGASGLIELIDSMHGRIVFRRKIQFSGWIKSQEQELILALNKSNYAPRDDKRERLERDKGMNMGSPELNEKWQKRIDASISKLDPDAPWKKALKFF